jgi:N-methylhydantoinase A/oxoprolinase/acetone carboxylase beta subunit
MGEALIPRGAGVASALGMLSSPFAFDFTRSYMSPLASLDLDRLNTMLMQIQEQGVTLLGAAGIDGNQMTVKRACDMRYRGQVHQITVPIPEGTLGPKQIEEIAATYDAEYERLYRRRNIGYSVECISWHVTIQGPPPKLLLPEIISQSEDGALKGHRSAYFGPQGSMKCGVYDRGLLAADFSIGGPAFVEERETTALIPPGWHAKIDRQQNLRISRSR